MTDPFASHISDTAFLVNESRRRAMRVSRDIYAEHWVPFERRDAVRELWEAFAREVYPHDDVALAVRNRFFLEHLCGFVAMRPDAVFINIGAGLTSYPFLTRDPITCVEIDLPHVVDFKRRQRERLIHFGILPPRDVALIAADVAKPQGQAALSEMLNAHRGRPLFVLMEGISYYLSRPVLTTLLASIAAAQRADDLVALDFWRPDIASHPVFVRLQAFFARRFGYGEQSYCLIDIEFFAALADYNVLRISDAAAEEHRFAGTQRLADRRNILEERYAVVRRR